MSISLYPARLTELLFTLVAVIATYYYLVQAMRGKILPLRLLPAVAAISDGVDKAVEEGKPVFVSPGNLAYLSGVYAPMTVAGMNLARYTARLCVRKGARIVLPVPTNPETFPLIDGIFREVCVSEGKPEAYHREDVRYYGSGELVFALGIGRDIWIEGCSLMIAVGANSTAEKYTMGIAYLNGALIIGGTQRWYHNATNAVEADYPLFSEDCYAAGSYATGDNVIASTWYGNDVFKLAIMIAIIVTVVLTIAGYPAVTAGGWFFQ